MFLLESVSSNCSLSNQLLNNEKTLMSMVLYTIYYTNFKFLIVLLVTSYFLAHNWSFTECILYTYSVY